MPADADETPTSLRRRLAEAQVDRSQLDTLRGELERSERAASRIPVLEDDVQHLRRRLLIARAEHERELRERTGELQAHLERAQQALRDLQASPSWRVTRPLRALKRLGR